MSSFFGVISNKNVLLDMIDGIDYHTHLGGCNSGITYIDNGENFKSIYYNRNDCSFRNKFFDFRSVYSNGAIGFIDYEKKCFYETNCCGKKFVIYSFGNIENISEIVVKFFNGDLVSNDEVINYFIQKENDILKGLKKFYDEINGIVSIIILTLQGELYCCRDSQGKLPMFVGVNEQSYCVSIESFVCEKLGYTIIPVKANEIIYLNCKTGIYKETSICNKLNFCSFMYAYYGHPASIYENINVEVYRNNIGKLMGIKDVNNNTKADYVCAIPESGISYAIGYANATKLDFLRPLIKYTDIWNRSFTAVTDEESKLIANHKQIIVSPLLKDKSIVLIDDSIVRGNQLHAIVHNLRSCGVREIHIRIATPLMIYGCKYLKMSRTVDSDDLIANKIIKKYNIKHNLNVIDLEYLKNYFCMEFNIDSIDFVNVPDILKTLNFEKNCLCTYCWNGNEFS